MLDREGPVMGTGGNVPPPPDPVSEWELKLTARGGGKYAGQEGVELALKILEDEFRLCMGLAGCVSVAEISKAHLMRVQGDGTLARL